TKDEGRTTGSAASIPTTISGPPIGRILRTSEVPPVPIGCPATRLSHRISPQALGAARGCRAEQVIKLREAAAVECLLLVGRQRKDLIENLAAVQVVEKLFADQRGTLERFRYRGLPAINEPLDAAIDYVIGEST